MQQENEEFYQKKYEELKAENESLSDRLMAECARTEELSFKLDRIHNNIFWKISKPFRSVMHFFIRIKDRIMRYKSLRNFLQKIKSKRIEKRAQKRYGKASFPDKERRRQEEETRFDRDITFSILVPLYNTPENFLREMMESVIAQTYQKWQLCLADGSDNAHTEVGMIASDYCAKDKRISYLKLEKNEGISGNTNRCFELATGDFIALFDHDDLLHPSVLYEYMKVICDKNADFIYCDETTFKGGSIENIVTMHFKPDYAIDTLRANNYICHFSAFDRNLLERTGLFRSEYDGSQDHDMILRLTTAARNVVHVPQILYYWRSHKGSVASDISAKMYAVEAAKGAVADHLRSCGFTDFEINRTRAFETIFKIRYKINGMPLISIIIPNKNHKEDLERCVNSIMSKSTYFNYEILVVENNSNRNDIFAYYEELKKNDKIRLLNYEGKFNYSAVNNFAAAEAKGEYLLLLNNDTEVITMNWLEELLMYAQRPDVGAVGAKLYYPNKTVQHAGIIIGLGAHRTAGHLHYQSSMEHIGYMGRLCYAQNLSAVTGACLMVKKELYDSLDGLDTQFEIALNDVDFCLRLRKAGYLNVFTPFAELWHNESVSRGLDNADERAKRYEKECSLFRERWKEQLESGDPYYNINFSLDRSDFSLKN